MASRDPSNARAGADDREGRPKLPERKPDSVIHSSESLPRVENGTFIFDDTTMSEFAAKLSLLRDVGLPVIDRTGMGGVYDPTLKEAAAAIRRDDAPPISTFLQESSSWIRIGKLTGN